MARGFELARNRASPSRRFPNRARQSLDLHQRQRRTARRLVKVIAPLFQRYPIGSLSHD